MKPAEYVDQSASGLALSLVDGPIDIRDLTVFREGSIGGRGVSVRAAIIGASHVLSFETGAAALTEMFACTEARGGTSRVLFGSLGELLKAATELTFTDGRRYRFRAGVMSLASTEAVRKRLAPSTTRGSRHLRLAFAFPRRADGSASPETIVSVRCLGNRVLARTAHCYPDERKVVLTSSELIWGSRV